MQTTDAAVLDALESMAVAQMLMAAALIVIALIAIGGALLVMLELRSVRRLMRGMVDTLDDLKPRLVPLIDRVSRMTNDAGGMTDDVRRRMDSILHTVEDLHRSLQRGGASLEKRARRFDAVLEVVQTEAEELMLDAAATAHGVHETARVLREPAARRRRPAVREDPEDEEEVS